MMKCAGCNRNIRPGDNVSAVFTSTRERSFFHKDCEEGVEHFARLKEEAPWAFKPTRLTLDEWKRCSPRKHLGVWQSIFIARRDEDVSCPDCGLKIARHENLTCPLCNGPVVILDAEKTRMVFTHGEPLYKLHLRCPDKGEESHSYAVVSGYTPVAVTPKKGELPQEKRTEQMMLKYEPKSDPRHGLTV